MAKAILQLQFVLLLITSTAVSLPAQRLLQVTVTDAASNQPIAFANVYLQSARIGEATDLEGQASIQLPEGFVEKGAVEVSFVGYISKVIPFDPVNDRQLFVALDYARVVLPEVEVRSGASSMTGSELIAAALDRIPDNYPTQQHRMEGLYREVIYENQRCAWLTEALILLDYAPYPQQSYVRKSWKAYWDENFYDEWLAFRQYRKNLVAGHPQFFKYYSAVEDKVQVLNRRKSDNLIEEQLEPRLWSGPLGLTAADKVKFGADFLDPKLKEAYDYQRGAAVMVNGMVCIAVHFRPKVLPKKIHHLWQEKIDFPLFSGTVYITAEELAIARVECLFAHAEKMERYQVSDPWQIYPGRILVEVNYRQQGATQRWFLHEVTIEQYFPGNSSEKWPFQHDYKVKRELYLQTGNQDDTVLPEGRLPLKDIQQSNLRDLPVTYDPEHWQQMLQRGNYPQLSSQERKELELNTPLEQQFMRLDQKP
ncbi:MAG: carboxypeptidase-like regulatory domain-containing protein [Saprospiraceae bacterium]|nr:carboxypeptidase-like regulatory domain-containing protein [Saprospiraceae bacterium]MDP4998338.1 carboxypeptidase-like regulatory domain-containing protein [Saprospiraceae bacterium]